MASSFTDYYMSEAENHTSADACSRFFFETHDKKYWRAIIELLPMGYNLRATVTMNYENVFNIINQREGHKVDEWNEFVKVLRGLPCVEDILRSDK